MHAVAYSANNTTDDQLSQSEGRGLDDSPNDHDDAPDPNDLTTTEDVPYPEAGKGTGETSD
jgi:hypothetical protein